MDTSVVAVQTYGVATTKVRVEEQWAADCLRTALDMRVCLHDDGLKDFMYDLSIRDETDREIGAVEVTMPYDAAVAVFWREASNGARWIEPSIEGGWLLHADPKARVKDLRLKLPALLRLMENAGLKQIERWHGIGNDLENAFDDLGIWSAHQSRTDYPGSIYLVPELPVDKMGGIVGETADPIHEWLTEWLRDPIRVDNLLKLESATAGDKHMFVVFPSFPDAPFTAWDPLARDNVALPTNEPDLPEPVTHLWAVSTWGSGPGLRWAPGHGWLQFDKNVPQEDLVQCL